MFEPYPIAKLHPEVDEVTVKYKQDGHMIRDWDKQERVMNKVMVRRVSCSNKSYNQGGFFLDMIVRDMVPAKEKHKKGADLCSGNEPSAGNRDCCNVIEYEISITYKQ